MDSETVIVLVLILAALVFLVVVEKNSRRNEAKLKADSAATAGPDQPSEQQPFGAGRRHESRKAKS